MKKTKKTAKEEKKVKEAKQKRKKKVVVKEIKPAAEVAKPAQYFEAVGRRKTAIARIRLFTKGEKTFSVNKRLLGEYFPTFELQEICKASLFKMNCLDKFGVSAVVKGGGLKAQAEAVRHATARALVLFNPDFRKRMKKAGFLTRDPRMRERKKFGLKRARRAPQWAKR